MHNENDRKNMIEDLRQVAASLQSHGTSSESGGRENAINRVAKITVDLISKSDRHRANSTSQLLSQAE
jgi:hypothetical protein